MSNLQVIFRLLWLMHVFSEPLTNSVQNIFPINSDHYIYICQKRAPLPATISEENEEQGDTAKVEDDLREV